MRTIEGFFASELAAIDQTIQRMQQTIDAEPSVNGRHDGMRALIGVQQRHRQIVELLAAQSSSFSAALDLCRGHLLVAEEQHARIALRGGAFDPRCAEAWWATLNDIEYLASLAQRLQKS